MKTKIYKALSILLTLAMIFTTCTCAFGTVSAAEATYYVSADGSDENDATVSTSAALTFQGAVQKAIDAGYTSEDVVTIKVVGTTAVAWGNYVDSKATIPTHDFKLVVTSDTSGATVGDNNGGVVLGGDIDFENITVWCSSYPTYSTIAFNNSNVNFASDTTIKSLNVANLVIGTNATYNAITEPLTYNVNTGIKYFKLTNDYNGMDYNADVTFNLNDTRAASASDTPVIYLSASNGTTKYNANLNINIIDAPAFQLTHGEKAPVFGENGALQIINSAGVEIVDSKGIITTAAEGKAYVLNNNSGIANLLGFTETAGKYAVNTDRYTVTATPVAEGDAIVAEDGYLEVPAGEYNITASKNPEQKTYTVAADGEYATVAAAVQDAVNGGYIKGDTVTVKVSGDAVDIGSLPVYKFDLIIESANPESKTTVNGTTLANNEGATTYYKNVTIGNGGAEWKMALAYSSSLSFDSNVNFNYGYGTAVHFGTGNDGGASKYIAGQNLYYAATNVPYSINLANGSWSGRKYTEDVNVTFENSNISPSVLLNAYYSGAASGSTQYQKNLNFNLKAIKGISFGQMDGVTYGTGVQILNHTSVDVTAASGFSSFPVDKTWLINNKIGLVDAIALTDTAGKYAVDTDRYTITATPVGEGEAVVAADGYLVVEAGVYNVTATKNVETKTYTVQTGTELETVYAAVEKAIADGYIAGDKITIQVAGESVAIGGNLPAYLFDLTIESADADVKTKIMIGSGQIIANNEGATTYYKNVEINNNSTQWTSVQLNSSNTYFDEKTSFNLGYGTYLTFGSGNDGGSNKSIAGQNMYIASNMPYAINFANHNWSGRKYTEDVNLTVNTTGAPNILFNAYYSGAKSGTTQYQKNVNIILNKASGLTFNQLDGATFEGGVQIMNNAGIALDVATLGTPADKTWIINNKTDDAEFITLTENAGKFAVKAAAEGYKVVAKPLAGGKAIEPENGYLTLAAGQYDILIRENIVSRTDEYSNFIAYRAALNGKNALNNVSAKIKNGEDINVVYYGGSVTGGTGASCDATSWRGIVSQWLEDNVPNSTVNNINSAIGGTGSFFGTYRLQEAVIEKQPDLLFIEFSINDNYDNTSENGAVDAEEAAKRFESIVRKVRQELPECDIVTVLTTDKFCISSLQQNNLHAQAKGHDLIAREYGIPTIYVGKALAAQLYADMGNVSFNHENAASMEAWNKYFWNAKESKSDIVHPNDVGYALYGEVITEYISNTLIFDNAILDDQVVAEVKDHIVPEIIVSKELYDGDIQVHKASQDMLDASIAAGGSEVKFETIQETPIKYFHEYLDVAAGDKVVFEFTGTELGIITHGTDNNSARIYDVVIKNKETGEEVLNSQVSYTSVKPGILARGLDYGTYVAEITAAFTGEGDWAWIHAFTTRDETKKTVQAAFPEGQEYTYYVSAEGSDETGNGLTAETAVKTLKKALEIANSSRKYATDTVTVRVIGSVAWGPNTAPWGTGISTTNLPEHDFKLIVTSDESGATVGDNLTSVALGGDTDFENITVWVSSYPSYRTLYMNNHIVNFASDVTIKSLNVANIVIGTSATHSIITEPSTYNVNAGIKYFRLSNDYNSQTYEADVTFNLNDTRASADDTPVIYLSANNGTTYYNANLNINIIDAPAFTLTQGENAPVFGENAALQIINSAGVEIVDSKGIITTAAEGKAYVLTNNTGLELLDFTETAGKYKVLADTTRFTVKAVPAEGDAITAADGYLTLEPGEYTITIEKMVETPVYNVVTGGEFATVLAAVEDAIANGYMAGDTVTVKVAGESVEFGGNLPAYKFDLVVTSADAAVKTKVMIGSGQVIANNEGATTSYKNVEINNNGKQWVGVYLNSSNACFDQNVKLSFGYGTYVVFGSNNDGGSNKTIAGQDMYIASNMPYAINFANMNWAGRTYSEDVNLTVNTTGNPNILFNAYYSGAARGTTKYQKNVNIVLEKAASIKFDQLDGATFEGGVQVMNHAGLTIDAATLGTPVEQTWVINNVTDDKNIISVTETAGTFALDYDKDEGKVTLTDAEGATTYPEGDTLTLAAGTYTIGFESSHSYTNFVADGNATCTDPGTATATCDCGCGRTKQREGEALGHSFTNYVYNNDATCTVDGTETASCDRNCGEKSIKTVPNTALGHSVPNFVYNNDATCTEDGTQTGTCDREECKMEVTEKVPYSAKGHTYGEYAEDSAPSCTETGSETATCTIDGCGATHTRIIAATGHVFDNDEDTICNVCDATRKYGTFFVGAEGDNENDGTANDKAVLTFAAAVQKAIDAEYVAGDIVTIKVVGTAAIAWGEYVDSKATIPEHAFKVVVTSETEGATIGDNAGGVALGGDTDFENITVLVSSYPKYYTMAFYDHIVNFASDVTIKSLNVANLVIGTNAGSNTITEPAVYNVNTGIKSFKLTNDYNGKTYDADITLNLNDKRASNVSDTPVIYLSAQNMTTTYNANVNINIKDAPAFQLAYGEKAPVFGENAALQIINSAGVEIADPKGILSSITGYKKFIITNNTGLEALEFTATAGKYKVLLDTERFTVSAVPAEGEAIVANDGFLTVPGGEYTLKVTKNPETKTYTVATEGEFATVYAAVEDAIAGGYMAGDTVTVKVAGESVEFGGNLPAYKFDLVVTSADAAVKTKVMIGSGQVIANNEGATTSYKNVEINNNGKQWTFIMLNSSNASFDADVKFNLGYGTYLNFGSGNDGGVYKYVAGQNLYLAAKAPYGVILANGSWSGRKYTEDVNVTIDNAESDASILMNSYYGGAQSGTTEYQKNLNLIFNAAKSIAFGQFDGATFLGGVQIINNSAVVIDANTTGVNSLPANTWILNNISGDKGVISLTETAGKFIIGELPDDYYVTFTDKNGNVTKATSGEFTIEPGRYTVEVTRDAVSDTYYVETGADGSADTYATVADAITAINAKEYLAKDTITLKLKGESVELGVLPEYVYNLVIDSADAATKTKVTFDGSAIIANNTTTTTTFKNVEINNGGETWKNIFLAGSDVVISADCKLGFGYGTGIVFGANADSNGAVTVAGQTVQIDCALPYAIYTSSAIYAARTYTEQVNLILNGTGTAKIMFNAEHASKENGTTTYEKAVNVVINNASAIELYDMANATFNDALQIVNNTDIVINEETVGFDALPEEVFILNNTIGKKDIIVLQEYAGEYEVNYDSDEQMVVAVDADGKVYETDDDSLELDYGVYTLKLACIECDYDFDCDTECNRCGAIRQVSHKYTTYTSDNNAKCEKDGTKTASCDYGCGEKNTVADKGSAKGHKWGEYVADGEATCKGGSKTAECVNGCGKKDTITDTALAVAHSYTNYQKQGNATCQKAETEIGTCKYGCGKTNERTVSGAKPVDHKYSTYKYNKDATCDKDGTETAKCDFGCGEKNTRTKTGTKGHKWGEYVKNNDGTCTKLATETAVCQNGCGKTDTRDIKNSYGDHVFKKYVYNEDATCTADGTETATCSVCDSETNTRTASGTKLGHDYKAATCKAPKTCKVCGKTSGEKASHDYEAATCTTAKTCKVCGKTSGEKLGHDYKAATCTTAKTCKVCGKTSGEKLGHDYKAATCTAPKTCKVCGKTSGDKAAHTYEKATCTKAKTCKVCKKTSGKALGHDYETKYTKATTKANGKSYKQCERCDKKTSESTIYKIKSVKLSTTSYTYNGKTKKPSVTVKDSKGKKIDDKYYTITRPSSSKNVGEYTVKVKFKTKYSGTVSLKYEINPAKSSVSSVTAAKKSLKVKIKKVSSQATGYEIQYSTSKKFTKSTTKTKKITSYKTTSATIKSLKAKKTYYVRVRTYKTVNGKKYYSDWSSYKSKKTK